MTKSILKNLLKSIISDLSSKQLKSQSLIKKDTRGKVFAIEGILRLYDKFPPKKLSKEDQKIISTSLLLIKELEDTMGATFFKIEALDFYINQDQVQSKVAQKLKEDQKRAENEFLNYLTKKKVVKSLTEMSKSLEKISYPEKSYYKKALKKETNRIDNKIKETLSPLINREEYTAHEVEEGVHEWRRMIRWVSIYLQSHKEMFYLKVKHKTKHKNLVKKYQNNKFCILGKKQSAEYKVSGVSFYKLSDYILKVGELKSTAELVAYLNENYGTKLKNPKIEKETKALFNKFQEDNILKKLL